MSASAKRLLVFGILALWTVPTAGALAVGLHLALDHHGHHPAGHDHDVAASHDRRHDALAAATGTADGHRHGAAPYHEHDFLALARAAAHGHHHHDAEAAPDHDHQALRDAAAPLPVRAPASAALPAAATAGGSSPGARPDPRSTPHRGPPTPLFRTHCSLLL